MHVCDRWKNSLPLITDTEHCSLAPHTIFGKHFDIDSIVTAYFLMVIVVFWYRRLKVMQAALGQHSLWLCVHVPPSSSLKGTVTSLTIGSMGALFIIIYYTVCPCEIAMMTAKHCTQHNKHNDIDSSIRTEILEVLWKVYQWYESP